MRICHHALAVLFTIASAEFIRAISPKNCVELGWKIQNRALFPGQCSASNLKKQCFWTTYAEAQQACKKHGARLCTRDELERDVSAGTGCNFDSKYVWTSSRCDGGAWVLPGSSKFQQLVPTKCSPLTAKAATRCCVASDTDWTRQRAVNSDPCTKLGWRITKPEIFPKLCAGTIFPDECHAAATYRQADELCHAAGARLCTITEVRNQVASGSSCKFDNKRIWTSTACPGGYWTSSGSKHFELAIRPLCSPTLTLAAVVCCSDVQREGDYPAFNCEQLGVTKSNYVNPARLPHTCGLSYIPEFCHAAKTYREAETICRWNGARLCSFAELQSDVAAGTGCGFDCAAVWSSTPCKDGSWTVAGATRCGDLASNKPIQPTCSKHSRLAAVRCCMRDTGIHSRLSRCKAYAWTINNFVQYPKVCAATSIPQTVYKGLTHKEALAMCTTYGARLCTLHELAQNATTGTGGALDDHFIWSSSRCDRSSVWVYNALAKSGKHAVCRHSQAAAAVRCCSSGIGNGATMNELTKTIQQIVANQKIQIEASQRATVLDRAFSEAAADKNLRAQLVKDKGRATPFAVMSPTPPMPSCQAQRQSISSTQAAPCSPAQLELNPKPAPCMVPLTSPCLPAQPRGRMRCPSGTAQGGAFCSYKGACNTNTGKCLCELGYAGAACELQLAQYPQPCSASALRCVAAVPRVSLPVSSPSQRASVMSKVQLPGAAVLNNPASTSDEI